MRRSSTTQEVFACALGTRAIQECSESARAKKRAQKSKVDVLEVREVQLDRDQSDVQEVWEEHRPSGRQLRSQERDGGDDAASGDSPATPSRAARDPGDRASVMLTVGAQHVVKNDRGGSQFASKQRQTKCRSRQEVGHGRELVQKRDQRDVKSTKPD